MEPRLLRAPGERVSLTMTGDALRLIVGALTRQSASTSHFPEACTLAKLAEEVSNIHTGRATHVGACLEEARKAAHDAVRAELARREGRPAFTPVDVQFPGCPACGGSEIAAQVEVDERGRIVGGPTHRATCTACLASTEVQTRTAQYYLDEQKAHEADPEGLGSMPPGVGVDVGGGGDA